MIKNKLKIKDQILISPSLNKGHKDINKKKIKKITPKLLFEPICELLLIKIKLMKVVCMYNI